MVASDRISAFDHLLEPGIPGKGELLTTLSLWWFDRLDGIPNHLASDAPIPDAVAGRAMLVKALDMYPIECVVRGYIAGSAWAEYQTSRSICGVPLPEGLQFGDRLPEPIFTPAFKAPLGQHDENISFERTQELVGPVAAELRELLGAGLHRVPRRSRRSAASCWRTPSSSSARTATRASPPWPTRCSPPTRLATGMPRTGPPAAARRASTSRSCATGWWTTGTKPAPRRSFPEHIVDQTAARYRELIDRLTR